jgi:hypothetical protein
VITESNETLDPPNNSELENLQKEEDLQAWTDEFGSSETGLMKVNLCSINHLRTTIEFDFYPNGIVRIEAVLDTGSEVSFLNKMILTNHAPHLLDLLKPCPIRFLGISGDPFISPGFLPLTCKIEGRTIPRHNFVIADIVETALLGLDFWNKHKVNWDYLRGCMTFDSPVLLVTNEQGQCTLIEDVLIPPKTTQCVNVEIVGHNRSMDSVLIQGNQEVIQNLQIPDLIGTVIDKQLMIEVTNTSNTGLSIQKGCTTSNFQS